MGKTVLAATTSDDFFPFLRMYAHCSKDRVSALIYFYLYGKYNVIGRHEFGVHSYVYDV